MIASLRFLQSWVLEKSQIEGSEQQDNADIRYQPFPEPASKEGKIDSDYDGYHR